MIHTIFNHITERSCTVYSLINTLYMQVTNHSGIEWMQRHLGDEYRVHTLAFKNQPGAMHIDTSLVFIKPGLAILNPDRPLLQKELFEKAGWKVVQFVSSVDS